MSSVKGWQCIFNAVAVHMFLFAYLASSPEWELFPVVLFIITVHATPRKFNGVFNFPVICFVAGSCRLVFFFFLEGHSAVCCYISMFGFFTDRQGQIS